MKGILKEELDRAFHTPRFIIVIVLALAIFIVGVYRSPFAFFSQEMHPVNCLLLNLEYGDFGFLATLMATLPFADSFLDDLNQGFLRQIVQRVPYKRYQWAKILAVALSGGFCLALAVLLIFLVSLMGAADWKSVAYFSGYAHSPTEPAGPFGSIYTLNPVYYLFYILFSTFGFGAVYAVLGLAISSLIHNRYVVLAGPLVLVQILDFLEDRSLHVTDAFNLLNGLLPFESSVFPSADFTVGVQLVQFVVVLAISVSAFLMLTRKQRLTF